MKQTFLKEFVKMRQIWHGGKLSFFCFEFTLISLILVSWATTIRKIRLTPKKTLSPISLYQDRKSQNEDRRMHLETKINGNILLFQFRYSNAKMLQAAQINLLALP